MGAAARSLWASISGASLGSSAHAVAIKATNPKTAVLITMPKSHAGMTARW
jgi:hypothetical protein